MKDGTKGNKDEYVFPREIRRAFEQGAHFSIMLDEKSDPPTPIVELSCYDIDNNQKQHFNNILKEMRKTPFGGMQLRTEEDSSEIAPFVIRCSGVRTREMYDRLCASFSKKDQTKSEDKVYILSKLDDASPRGMENALKRVIASFVEQVEPKLDLKDLLIALNKQAKESGIGFGESHAISGSASSPQEIKDALLEIQKWAKILYRSKTREGLMQDKHFKEVLSELDHCTPAEAAGRARDIAQKLLSGLQPNIVKKDDEEHIVHLKLTGQSEKLVSNIDPDVQRYSLRIPRPPLISITRWNERTEALGHILHLLLDVKAQAMPHNMQIFFKKGQEPLMNLLDKYNDMGKSANRSM